MWEVIIGALFGVLLFMGLDWLGDAIREYR